jgi:hypothetical protein
MEGTKKQQGGRAVNKAKPYRKREAVTKPLITNVSYHDQDGGWIQLPPKNIDGIPRAPIMSALLTKFSFLFDNDMSGMSEDMRNLFLDKVKVMLACMENSIHIIPEISRLFASDRLTGLVEKDLISVTTSESPYCSGGAMFHRVHGDFLYAYRHFYLYTGKEGFFLETPDRPNKLTMDYVNKYSRVQPVSLRVEFIRLGEIGSICSLSHWANISTCYDMIDVQSRKTIISVDAFGDGFVRFAGSPAPRQMFLGKIEFKYKFNLLRDEQPSGLASLKVDDLCSVPPALEEES